MREGVEPTATERGSRGGGEARRHVLDRGGGPQVDVDDRVVGLHELIADGEVRPDTAERVRGLLGFRRDRFRARFDDSDDGAIEERSVAYQALMRQLLDAERAALLSLRNEGVINDTVMQRVQRDLDLETARLDQ